MIELLGLLNQIDWTSLDLQVGILIGLLFRRKAEKVAGRLRERVRPSPQGDSSSDETNGQRRLLNGSQ